MKRILRYLSASLAAIAIFLGSSTAQAQRGYMSFGLAAGFATYNDGGYANVFMQCGVAPHVRIAPEIGYIFRNDGKEGLEISADVQIPFTLLKGVTVYPLIGVTYNHWKYVPVDDSINRVGVDIGAGLDINLTSNIKLIIQGKGSLMNDTSGGFFSLGFGYVL